MFYDVNTWKVDGYSLMVSSVEPGAEGRGGKQGPEPPLKYFAPIIYIYIR
jgi:hypothetical protein